MKYLILIPLSLLFCSYATDSDVITKQSKDIRIGIIAPEFTFTPLVDAKQRDSEVPLLHAVRETSTPVLLTSEGGIKGSSLPDDELHRLINQIFAIRFSVDHHLVNYPKSTLKDLYKNYFQDKFGPGHIIADTAAAGAYLRKEISEMSPSRVKPHEIAEPTGWEGNYYRVDLSVITENRVPYKTFFDAFVKSVNSVEPPSLEAWKEEWKFIETVISAMNLSLPGYKADKETIERQLANNEYVGHHSTLFEESYSPHYRIISKEVFEKEIQPLLR